MIKEDPGMALKLVEPNGVESLVRSGRVPQTASSTEDIIFFVPPEGTQFGDQMEFISGAGPIFKSPDGTPRGETIMCDLPMDEANKVLARIKSVLEEMDI